LQRLTGKKAVILVLSLIIFFFYGCSDVGYEEETILQEENTSNVVYQENINTVLENEEDIISETQIVADYLEMNSEEFLSIYNKNELYEKGFLYCGMESWKYQGTQLDAYQEDYYNVTDITAIRIRGKQESDDAVLEKDLDTKPPGFVCIKYLGDYAISSYLQESMNSENNNDHALSLVEVSFIKVELEDGIPPEILYSYLENDYYQVKEELQEALWTESPDGTKEAYISNGSLPSHPSQIFVRYKEEAPDSIFRREWQCEIVGWIDEEHLVCNEVDMGPILIHLENNQVEQIKKEDDDFDPYGAKYIIDGNYLICQVMDEEIYRWNIVSKEDEVLISAVGFEKVDEQENTQDIQLKNVEKYKLYTPNSVYTSYEFCNHIFISIIDEEKKYFDILEIPNEMLSKMGGLHGDGPGICLEDINFDGYKDIIFLGSYDGLELYHKCIGFLWNQSEKRFELDETVPTYFDYIDAERKRLIFTGSLSAFDDSYYIYEYINGVFEEKRLDVTFNLNESNSERITWEYYENDIFLDKLVLNYTEDGSGYYNFYGRDGSIADGTFSEEKMYSELGMQYFAEFDFYNHG